MTDLNRNRWQKELCMSSNQINVMIIDDSVLVRKYVSQILDEISDMQLVATAPNGKIGLQKMYLYKPDVVILDIEMPEMNGLEFLKYIQANVLPSNRPQVIVFSSLVGEGSSVTFEALALGAADFIKKPDGKVNEHLAYLRQELELKIHALARSKSSPAPALPENKDNIGLNDEDKTYLANFHIVSGIQNWDMVLAEKDAHPQLIAVGSSTGGPNSIRKMLTGLDKLPIPMVIAQHMPAGFTTEFAKNLSKIFEREVVELQDGNILKNGVIYICPGGCHSRIVKSEGKLKYQADNKEYEGFFFKPSVDLFFASVRECVGKNAIGIVLSGMGKDGSIESVKLRKEGAVMIAQDKKSSVVWGMPGTSVKNGGVDAIIEISDISKAINTTIRKLCVG